MSIDITGARIFYTFPFKFPILGQFSLTETLVVSWIVMLIAVGLTIASMIDYLSKARYVIGLGVKDGAVDAEEGLDELAIARQVVDTAREHHVSLATAESLTGGLIGAAITAIPGSSDVFIGGITSYANEAKCNVLEVQPRIIDDFGAVSEQCALQMAEGARTRLDSDVALSVTGIAGPGGAVPGKPVGTVWMGVSTAERTYAKHFAFDGDRESIRRQTVEEALRAFLEVI